MDKSEKLLKALAWMSKQYLEEDGVLDHHCMSAGEEAMSILFAYDLLDCKERGAVWTENGEALVASR